VVYSLLLLFATSRQDISEIHSSCTPKMAVIRKYPAVTFDALCGLVKMDDDNSGCHVENSCLDLGVLATVSQWFHIVVVVVAAGWFLLLPCLHLSFAEAADCACLLHCCFLLLLSSLSCTRAVVTAHCTVPWCCQCRHHIILLLTFAAAAAVTTHCAAPQWCQDIGGDLEWRVWQKVLVGKGLH